MNKEYSLIRRLAEQYAEICALPIQEKRRRLWRDHNSLIRSRVPILCSWYWGSNVERDLLTDQLECTDPILRHYELWLRNRIFHETIGDDTVQEPWITVRAAHRIPEACRNGNTWGIMYERETRRESGAWVTQPTISTMENIAQMISAEHAIDELETATRVSKIQEAVGGCLEVNVDRGPFYECYGGSDLCEALTYLLGLENLMVFLHKKPELIHALDAFMRDAIVRQYQQAQAAGDWGRTNNFNMGMPYARELPDPKANSREVPMKSLWFFTCSQAFTVVSPRMFEEFMLQYQMPIVTQFGLVSYGCCEDLTRKIQSLKKIPNLRRIGVSPMADVRKCAEQIGSDYVLSWKPNPSMICCGFDEEAVRKALREGLEASKGCVVDIMLKDISTVERQPERLARWTQIAREVAEPYSC